MPAEAQRRRATPPANATYLYKIVLSSILLCFIGQQGEKMRYVYLLQSIRYPDQRYIGLTNNLRQRLAKHNEGSSPHTSKYAPWRIATAIRFDDDQRASAFERYLKTGSGRAFAKKHLW
jgi:predicted GIY-YIG superfamily endonuclease